MTTLAEASAEYGELSRRIEELRAFEREYRSRLRGYHLDRLRELEIPDGEKKHSGRVTREWSDLPGTNMRVRLTSFGGVNDGAFAWIEVDTR